MQRLNLHNMRSVGVGKPSVFKNPNMIVNGSDLSSLWLPSNVTLATTGFTETAVSGAHLVSQNLTTIIGQPYTFSADIVPNGRTWALIWFGNTMSKGVYFNLADGTFGTVSAGITSYSATPISGGYRCSITLASATSTDPSAQIYACTGNGAFSYLGDITKGLNITKVKVENSLTATPY